MKVNHHKKPKRPRRVKEEGVNSSDVVTRARHKIIILLLVDIICDSLPLLISNDYVLEITSNEDLVLYIYCSSNSLQSGRDCD